MIRNGKCIFFKGLIVPAAVSGWLAASVLAGVSPAMAQSRDSGSPASSTWAFRPYTGTSQFFRDLIAKEPMDPVKLRIDPRTVSDNPGYSVYSFSRFANHVRATPLEVGLVVGTLAATGVGGWQ